MVSWLIATKKTMARIQNLYQNQAANQQLYQKSPLKRVEVEVVDF